MSESFDLTIRFPTAKSRRAFAVFLSDGGGEQDFFRSFEGEKDPAEIIWRMQYHSENPKFATNDKRRYGKFIADNLIIAHNNPPKE